MSRNSRLQKRINEAYAKGYAAGLKETAHLSEQFEGSQGGGGETQIIGTMRGGGAIDFNDYTYLLSLLSDLGGDYLALQNVTVRQGTPGILVLPSGVFINVTQGSSPFVIVNRRNPPGFEFNFDALGQYFGIPNPVYQQPEPPLPPRSMRPGTNFARPSRQAPRPGIQGPGGGFGGGYGGGMQPPMPPVR